MLNKLNFFLFLALLFHDNLYGIFMASLHTWKHRSVDRRLKLPFFMWGQISGIIKVVVFIIMAQSIPSVPIPPGYLSGICYFVLEKLQMPHGGAGRSYKPPWYVGLKIRVQMPKSAFSSK